MKKIITFAFALIVSMNLFAYDYDINMSYCNRYYYSTDGGYYEINMNGDGWGFQFDIKVPITGPVSGTTYTLNDMMLGEYKTYGYQPWNQELVNNNITFTNVAVKYTRIDKQEKVEATIEGSMYMPGEMQPTTKTFHVVWNGPTPVNITETVKDTLVADVTTDTQIGTYTIQIPYGTYDYSRLTPTVALIGEIPTEGQTKTYTWENGIYIPQTRLSEYSLIFTDVTAVVTGKANGALDADVTFECTDGKEYKFHLVYAKPHEEESVFIEGINLKESINWDNNTYYQWQDTKYSLYLYMNVAVPAEAGKYIYKGDQIGQSSFSITSPSYLTLDIYEIDSVVITKDVEGLITLKAGILCKNNVKYYLTLTNEIEKFYIKYAWDGKNETWKEMEPQQFGNGSQYSFRYYGSDDVYINKKAEDDQNVEHYSIAANYYSEPIIWIGDSIQFQYDPTNSLSKTNIYMQEKHYDAVIYANEANRSYNPAASEYGTYTMNFKAGEFPTTWTFNFGFLYTGVKGPQQYKTYKLSEMDENSCYGYDTLYNRIEYQYAYTIFNKNWPNSEDQIELCVLDKNNKSYHIFYNQENVPEQTDTINYNLAADIRQFTAWQIWESVNADDGTKLNLALADVPQGPNTYYWPMGDIYPEATEIIKSDGSRAKIGGCGSAWVQTYMSNWPVSGTDSAEVWLPTYEGITYHFTLRFTAPTPEDTVEINANDLVITPWESDGCVNFSAFNDDYQVSICIAGEDILGIFKDEVMADNSTVHMNNAPYTTTFGYSSDSIEVKKDQNENIVLTGNMLCKNNVLYVFNLTTAKTSYFLGVQDGQNITWTPMEEQFYQSGASSGDWKATATFDGKGVYINTKAEADGHEKFFAAGSDNFITDPKDPIVAGNLVDFTYNIYQKWIVAIKSQQTGLNSIYSNKKNVVKALRDGKIVIEKDGVRYNVTGTKLR